LYGQNLIIFGGSEDKHKNDILKFEFKNGNFQKISPSDEEKVPSARDFHAAVIDQEKIYIIGVSYLRLINAFRVVILRESLMKFTNSHLQMKWINQL
jgi:hypothetical protein